MTHPAGLRLTALLYLAASCALAGEVVLERWYVEKRGAHPEAVTIEDNQRIRVNLTSLPKDAQVHSARLILQRDPIDGTMDEALVDAEVVAPAGTALALLPPWYDSFDATAAVRGWVKDPATNQGFTVKALPKWLSAKTALGICFEGVAMELPAQAKGLRVLHRAGQTFVTWEEIEKRTRKEELTWGELRALIADVDGKSEVRYRTYRHAAPINASNIAQAEFVAEVAPLSAYNGVGRSVDELICQTRRRAIDDLELSKELARTDYFTRYHPAMPEMDQVVLKRLAIENGKPLAPNTGLYVHHPAKQEKAYYAVVSMVDGVANLREFSESNSLAAPVQEGPGLGEPVLQGTPQVVVFFDYPGTRRQYVQWAAPPLAHLPGQYYNWGVFVPRDFPEAQTRRLSIFFHDRTQRYLKPPWPHRQDTVLLSPHDAPFASYGYGYHESLGTLRSFKQGRVQPFFARRVDAMREWALKEFGADGGRVSCGGHGSWGGTAALQYGLKRPGKVAYIMADESPDADPVQSPYADTVYGTKHKTHRAALDAVWGKPDWRIAAESGKPIWEEANLPAYVRAVGKATTLPFFSLGAGSQHLTWKQETELMRAYLETGNGFMGEFWWGGAAYLPLPAGAETGEQPFEPRADRPLLACASKDCGPNPKFMQEQFETGKRGYFGGGRLNTKPRWEPEDIVDTPERLEMTIFAARNVAYAGGEACDTTLRNAQKFKPKAGEKITWSVSDPQKGKKIKSGETVVGEDGLVRIPAVPFGETARLALERAAQ